MNLNKRIECLGNKSFQGKGLTVIKLKLDETKEQALERYCSENGVTAGKLDHPESITVYLRAQLAKEEWLERCVPQEYKV